MKFKLIIDKDKPEEVVATVHTPFPPFSDALEILVLQLSGSGYMNRSSWCQATLSASTRK